MIAAMGFWDWLFGKGDDAALADQHTARAVPALPPSSRDVTAEAPPPPADPPKPKAPAFGIQQAIALMRKLPLDQEPELVLRVVRKTLQSTGVSLEDVIGGARKREKELAETIAADESAIEKLEREIAERRANIGASTKDLGETRDVRERLQEAAQSESKVGILVPPAEIARIQAEADAKRAAAPPAPKSVPPPPPKLAASVPPKLTPSKAPPLPPRRAALPDVPPPDPMPKVPANETTEEPAKDASSQSSSEPNR
jgi:hypothetical protein